MAFNASKARSPRAWANAARGGGVARVLPNGRQVRIDANGNPVTTRRERIASLKSMMLVNKLPRGFSNKIIYEKKINSKPQKIKEISYFNKSKTKPLEFRKGPVDKFLTSTESIRRLKWTKPQALADIRDAKRIDARTLTPSRPLTLSERASLARLSPQSTKKIDKARRA